MKATSEKIRALRIRAGLSVRAAAAHAGMKSASNWQHYESPSFLGTSLPADYTLRLAKVWPGLGEPPIKLEDVLELNPELLEFAQGRGATYAANFNSRNEQLTIKIEVVAQDLKTFSAFSAAIDAAVRDTLKEP